MSGVGAPSVPAMMPQIVEQLMAGGEVRAIVKTAAPADGRMMTKSHSSARPSAS
jgi:hypothetical protein